MSLFSKTHINVTNNVFNKIDVINDIFETSKDHCPEWKFFVVSKSEADKINSDFLVIYTDIINKQISLKGNPFSEYKRTVESIYQIVREVYITDKNDDEIFNNDNLYKCITASSAKELFIKLKKEKE